MNKKIRIKKCMQRESNTPPFAYKIMNNYNIMNRNTTVVILARNLKFKFILYIFSFIRR